MNAAEQARHPAGAPRHLGGQWREHARPEADVDLSLGRERAVAAGEPVPAVYTTETMSAHVGDWWDAQASVAEWAGKGAAYPKMPGDWTPQRTGGTADTGRRRTHRMTYTGNGFALRMPSATSIRSFADSNPGAFDIPIEATNGDGRSITAWVRAVRHGRCSWAVSGLGFGGGTDAQVSEAVASVLEARRPSAAVRQAGDLIEKHRQRLADAGVVTENVRSSWIAAVGYDTIDGLLIMRTRPRTTKDGVQHAGRSYGSLVPRAVFDELRASDQPGMIFNAMVKGNPGVMVETCPTCNRTHARSRKHTCPTRLATMSKPPTTDVPDQSSGRRAAVRGIHRRRARRGQRVDRAGPEQTRSGDEDRSLG